MNEIIIEIFKVQSDFALEVWFSILVLALKVPITTIVVCFTRLLKCLKKLMTVLTHIRLFLYEQSDLGPCCLLLYLNS